MSKRQKKVSPAPDEITEFIEMLHRRAAINFLFHPEESKRCARLVMLLVELRELRQKTEPK